MLSIVYVILCLKMCQFLWSLHHYAVAGLYKCYTVRELFHFHDSMLTKIMLFNMVRRQNTSSLFVRSWPSTLTPNPWSLLWTLLGSHLKPRLWCTSSQGPALLTLLNTSDLAPKSGDLLVWPSSLVAGSSAGEPRLSPFLRSHSLQTMYSWSRALH